MYIRIKYADNQSLIVNPMCSVINLLTAIKNMTGHAADKDMLIDLSDETGLIQDLEVHGREYATKFLSSHGTYILMEKQLLLEGEKPTPTTIQQALHSYNYVPLLEHCAQLYPNFKIHLSEAQKKKLKPLRNVDKNPSPAGRMPTTRNTAGSRSTAGRPPRSNSRGKSRH
ncbi:uncharacterized protein CXorf65-like [Watersipora subatra]|uniref:uncharacterized protein CXorf65-like n=1 Tax=Watersipora subatra TaxID=2589382 RepID=UPI00355B12F2